MADIFETWDTDVDSPDKGTGGSYARTWKVMGEPSSSAAIEAVRALAPVAVIVGDDTLIRQNATAKSSPTDNWEVTVTYGGEEDSKSEERPEPGFWKWRWRTTGGTETVKFAPMISRHWNSALGEAPAMTAINFDGKDVKGIEIPKGELSFDITAYYEAREVTPAFAIEMSEWTGAVNNDEFLGFPVGSLRYEGSEGEGDIPTLSGQRMKPIPATHHFTFSPNDDDVQIDGIDTGALEDGSALSKIAKEGWQYLSVRDLKSKDESSNTVLAKPKHAYIHAPHFYLAFIEFFGFGGPPT